MFSEKLLLRWFRCFFHPLFSRLHVGLDGTNWWLDEADGHQLHESIVRGGANDHSMHILVVCGELALLFLPDSILRWKART